MEGSISGRQAGAWGFCAVSVPAVLTCAGLGWGWVLLGCAIAVGYYVLTQELAGGAVYLPELTVRAFGKAAGRVVLAIGGVFTLLTAAQTARRAGIAFPDGTAELAGGVIVLLGTLAGEKGAKQAAKVCGVLFLVLAWTEVGGDTLEIEVNTMPGEGNLKLTGQLGDVMKESAEIALSLVRALLPREEEFFKTHDFHLHVPEGAVPKDGPSAGVTMTTAIYSAVTGKKVLAKVAMTGEITLRGRVLPIGGLKEKLLAAKQAGIQKVVVPKENKPDVEELEEEITEGMQIVFAGSISDVLKEALVQK